MFVLFVFIISYRHLLAGYTYYFTTSWGVLLGNPLGGGVSNFITVDIYKVPLF